MIFVCCAVDADVLFSYTISELAMGNIIGYFCEIIFPLWYELGSAAHVFVHVVYFFISDLCVIIMNVNVRAVE